MSFISRRIQSRGGTIAAGSPIVPFTVSFNPTDDSITIQPGVVNQLLPSNMYSGANNSPIFVLGAPTVYYVYLVCSTNGQSVTACPLSISVTPPSAIGNTSASAPATFHLALATVIGNVNNRTVYQHNTGNADVLAKQSFLVGKTGTINPGQEPFDRYYTWVAFFGV